MNLVGRFEIVNFSKVIVSIFFRFIRVFPGSANFLLRVVLCVEVHNGYFTMR